MKTPEQASLLGLPFDNTNNGQQGIPNIQPSREGDIEFVKEDMDPDLAEFIKKQDDMLSNLSSVQAKELGKGLGTDDSKVIALDEESKLLSNEELEWSSNNSGIGSASYPKKPKNNKEISLHKNKSMVNINNTANSTKTDNNRNASNVTIFKTYDMTNPGENNEKIEQLTNKIKQSKQKPGKELKFYTNKTRPNITEASTVSSGYENLTLNEAASESFDYDPQDGTTNQGFKNELEQPQHGKIWGEDWDENLPENDESDFSEEFYNTVGKEIQEDNENFKSQNFPFKLYPRLNDHEKSVYSAMTEAGHYQPYQQSWYDLQANAIDNDDIAVEQREMDAINQSIMPYGEAEDPVYGGSLKKTTGNHKKSKRKHNVFTRGNYKKGFSIEKRKFKNQKIQWNATRRTIMIGNQICGSKMKSRINAIARQNSLRRSDFQKTRMRNEIMEKTIDVFTCCDEHFKCPRFVPAKSTKYGYTNDLEYNVMECNCDNKFRDCLKKCDSNTADAVGHLYFNTLRIPCLTFSEQSEEATIQTPESMNVVSIIPDSASDTEKLGKAQMVISENEKESPIDQTKTINLKDNDETIQNYKQYEIVM